MTWTVLIDPSTLEIRGQFLTSGQPFVFSQDVQCTCEDPSVMMAVRDPEGNVTLVEDPVKLAAKAEAQKSQNKAKRNQLLQSSDWSTLSDVSGETASPVGPKVLLSNKDEWIQYRAALRAVDLTEPVWPQEPSVVWAS